jgi:hypothetical protein
MTKNKRGGHLQVHLVLTRKIKADAGIAPLIAWMNKQHNIITHFSCQGRGEEGTGFPRPMVSFHAITRNALYKLMRKLGMDTGNFNTVLENGTYRTHYEAEAVGLSLDYWEVHGNTNYKLEWADHASLDRTMRALGLKSTEEP